MGSKFKAPLREDFQSIVNKLTDVKFADTVETLKYIFASGQFLQNHDVDFTIAENHSSATRLQDRVIEIITPTDIFAEEPPFAAEPRPTPSPQQISTLISLKTTGLCLLRHLHNLNPPPLKPTATLLACLSSFTDPRDAWTNQESHHLATLTLSHQTALLKEGENPNHFEELITVLLKEHIKPLFLKSKSPILTEQARKKTTSSLPAGPSDFDNSGNNKPWKYHSPHIITVFRWVLTQLDTRLVETLWPLVIPPLLSLLDDSSTAHKVKGCEMLRILLEKVPLKLLARSGLGEVFQETLMPYLMYLPSLTPVDESVVLLDAVYDALIALTMVQHASNAALRTKALGAVFRNGILKGYAHAGENVRIAELLMRKAADLVCAMKIHCVKHLKDLLPLIAANLTAPFATAHPPLLEATLETLRVVIVNGWPRLAFHPGVILEGLIICYSRIDDEDKPTAALVEIQTTIKEILSVVMQLLNDDDIARSEVQALRESEPRLSSILGT
ncbi:MAG: hypothetical protein Q9222_000759 [Ikaeria aurantiellina]